MGRGRCRGRPARHRTPSQCWQGPTLLSRRSLLSRSSLRSFSTFSSLLFSCWISSCNRAGGEGGRQARGEEVGRQEPGRSLHPPQAPPPALGGQGGGSPGRGPLSPAKGWAGTFPIPLRRRADSNPINGVEMPGSPALQQSRRGVPASPAREGGSKPTHRQLAEGFGCTQPRWGGRGPTRMPRDHQSAPGRCAWLPASSTSFSPLLWSQQRLGGQEGAQAPPPSVPVLGRSG